MPTAAKLFAALALALVAAIVSEQVKPLLPEGTDFGYFTLINAAYGAFFGWRFVGRHAGNGMIQAMNHGLTGMLALVIFALFMHGARLMLSNSLKMRYDSVAEAIQSIFGMMLENGLLLLHPPIITTLLAGALLSGLLAEAASRRWR
ncbi:hypothetical protein NBRC116601_08170 [Cognatishimia sp. WU-CL00825]|uniref:TrgA family protein n=1 Tax=Cognatishimia sp. WU-CL00825 TaxID=3127658 RepID=UPI003107A405